ncbi:MAG: hypothetical protein HY958_03590 [Bacteroidia bacterium]|nr:hypothetical protein [Bacteroidia bacterium]
MLKKIFLDFYDFKKEEIIFTVDIKINVTNQSYWYNDYEYIKHKVKKIPACRRQVFNAFLPQTLKGVGIENYHTL